MRFGAHAILWILPMLLVLRSNESSCLAGFTFLGPTPYLSAADSPFPVDGSNPNFFLEDFEDGELNTPGIVQPLHPVFGTAFHGEVMGPSEFTDSVDGDDGIIDGWGTAGHSFRSRSHIVLDTFPQRNQLTLYFGFDKDELGYLPNAFGFVWTDGRSEINTGNELSFGFEISDPNGDRLATSGLFVPPDDMRRDGGSAEDVFIGITSDSGIASVRIVASFVGESDFGEFFEIDHVQYGVLQVPEASSIRLFLLLGLGGLANRWRYRGH